MATVTDFIFLDSKITADGDCSHKIKRRLLLGRKAMTNLDSVLKSRDITLNWCFWTVVLEKTLRVPWTARRSILNIFWKDLGWSWSSNTLAIWSEELTHWKRPWCCKRLNAGGEGDNREWDGWMALPTQWTWVWASSGSWWWTGKPGMLQSMELQSWTRLSDWTDLTDLV